MPFDHNDHYHRLLLRLVPRDCGAALDVGCGTGRFARRLAALVAEVDAVDPSAEAVAEARALSDRTGAGGNPHYRQADVTDVELPRAHYDFVSCLASIHHMPFETVSALRAALAPGGVLVILGCYPERSRTDWAWSLAAVPVNAVARLAVAVADAIRPAAPDGRARARTTAPVAPPTVPLHEIRRAAAELLPGATVRRLLFWRYLLVFRNGARPDPGAGRPAGPGVAGSGLRTDRSGRSLTTVRAGEAVPTRRAPERTGGRSGMREFPVGLTSTIPEGADPAGVDRGRAAPERPRRVRRDAMTATVVAPVFRSAPWGRS